MDREQQVREFFNRYQALFEDTLGEHPTVDVDAIVASFAPYFVESSPAGVRGGENDEQFREMIPRGYDFYRSIGTVSMEVASVDVTSLDALHVMARVGWVSRFATGQVIEFENIYFLTFATLPPKIFAYITPDEEAALREHGLLPNAS